MLPPWAPDSVCVNKPHRELIRDALIVQMSCTNDAPEDAPGLSRQISSVWFRGQKLAIYLIMGAVWRSRPIKQVQSFCHIGVVGDNNILQSIQVILLDPDPSPKIDKVSFNGLPLWWFSLTVLWQCGYACRVDCSTVYHDHRCKTPLKRNRSEEQ